MQFAICEARMKDVKGYHACLTSVALERKHIGFVEAPPLRDSRKWMKTALDARNPFLVLTKGSTIVGWCDVVRREREGLIATQRVTAAGFVSLAGPGWAAPAIIREQLRGAPNLARPADRILSELEAGRTTDSVPPELRSLFRPSVQPYLISWFRYDPAKEIAKVTVPVLIVQGSTDRQVSVEDAHYLKKGDQQAQFRIVPGMNHLLKAVPDDDGKQLASLSDPAIPIHTMLIDETRAFAMAADQRRDVGRH